MARGPSQHVVNPAECFAQGREEGEVRSGSCALQEAEDFVPRGSEDSSCSNALLEMSDLSRAVLSPSLQGEGCFYLTAAGTEPSHLWGSFTSLSKSCSESLGLPGAAVGLL